MKFKIILYILCFLFISNSVQASEIATQTLNINLGEILEISKIIVDGVEYDVDENFSNVKKRNVSSKTRGITRISLSPIKVKIHTNLSTPIMVNAEFQELNHSENLHNFNPSDLSFIPDSRTINNPYDNVITDEFVPVINVTPDTIKGLYNGQIMFTLGAI